MVVTAKQALKALDRYLHCEERERHNHLRAVNHGTSVTGDRYAQTAANWGAKADAALHVVRAFIEQEASNAVSP